MISKYKFEYYRNANLLKPYYRGYHLSDLKEVVVIIGEKFIEYDYYKVSPITGRVRGEQWLSDRDNHKQLLQFIKKLYNLEKFY